MAIWAPDIDRRTVKYRFINLGMVQRQCVMRVWDTRWKAYYLTARWDGKLATGLGGKSREV